MLVSQDDNYPVKGHSPTSTWQAGTLYFDVHVLPLAHLLPGEYELGIKVYHYNEGQITDIPLQECVTDCSFFPYTSIIVE